MGMDQYLLIPFLGEWTSIYQLFWCSPGVQGFDTLPYRGFSIAMWITGESPVVKPWSQGTSARQKNHPQNLCTRHSPGRLDTFGHQVTIGDLWSLLGSWFLMGFSMDGDGMSFSHAENLKPCIFEAKRHQGIGLAATSCVRIRGHMEGLVRIQELLEYRSWSGFASQGLFSQLI